MAVVTIYARNEQVRGSILRGGSMGSDHGNDLGQVHYGPDRVLLSPLLLPLVESLVVRDRLPLRWECRDRRVGIARTAP